MSDNSNSSDDRTSKLIERALIGILVIVLGAVQLQYNRDQDETKQELRQLDMKVLDLYRSSVTKQELKELETRLTANVEGIRSDIRQILTFYMDKDK